MNTHTRTSFHAHTDLCTYTWTINSHWTLNLNNVLYIRSYTLWQKISYFSHKTQSNLGWKFSYIYIIYFFILIFAKFFLWGRKSQFSHINEYFFSVNLSHKSRIKCSQPYKHILHPNIQPSESIMSPRAKSCYFTG